MSKITRTLFAALLAVTLSQAAQSTVLLHDDFNADNAGSVLNVPGLTNWTVDNGTVDYIRNGGYGIACQGGSGGCIDMDGSTSDAGRLVSRATFALLPTGVYTVFFDVSGNQRGGADDELLVAFLDATTNTELPVGGLVGISSNLSYQTFGFGLSHSPDVVAGHQYRIVLKGTGGDNLGAILDNVEFIGDVLGGQVPEPGSLALVALGLGAAATLRRRARR